MIFLRADAPGNRGQHVVFADLRGRAREIASYNQPHEFANLNPDRAFVHAGGLLTLQAAQCLLSCELGGVAEVYFRKVLGPLLRWLFGHGLPRHFDPLL